MTINGIDIRAIGVTPISVKEPLLASASVKDYIVNESPLKDGKEVILPTGTPKLAARDVVLIFGVKGRTDTEYLSNLDKFYAELYKGEVVLAGINNTVYHLHYVGCNDFANARASCKITVKFTEGNPRNRK